MLQWNDGRTKKSIEVAKLLKTIVSGLFLWYKALGGLTQPSPNIPEIYVMLWRKRDMNNVFVRDVISGPKMVFKGEEGGL